MNQVKLGQDGISIVGSLTRENVTALRQELLSALASAEAPRVVRLASVSSVDSAGIQLLSALVKAFPSVRLSAPSEALSSALGRLGALDLIGSTA